MTDSRLTDPNRKPGESAEVSLRPQHLYDFIGQEEIKNNLRVFIDAAKGRGEVLDHVLLYGPPGLGKTTLAGIIANEMELDVRHSSGPAFQNSAELVGLLTQQDGPGVVFIDEIHRLNRIVEEYLYPAMEDLRIEIVVDSGPNARHFQLDLEPFTLIGATTRAGMLTGALRSRFGIICHLDFYPADELKLIVQRSAQLLGVNLTEDGALEISRRSRGTPRAANRLLRRVRDFAQVENSDKVDAAVADRALNKLGVDKLGLEPLDRRYLKLIVEHFGGGPVGIQNLAVSLGEELDTLEDVIEPFLIQSGLMKRTSRGREITSGGLNHLGFVIPDSQGELS
ncbi:MAG: Holliday junction branch migration DNA helicase RuvB [bacterium]|nr:Holliday junction branch migration DNA helicase RuvB [bacterium]MCP4798780.1 Holliday junction branch migration DNA helicase RuvB [bacterium]